MHFGTYVVGKNIYCGTYVVGGSASCPSVVAPDNIWLVHLRHSNSKVLICCCFAYFYFSNSIFSFCYLVAFAWLSSAAILPLCHRQRKSIHLFGNLPVKRFLTSLLMLIDHFKKIYSIPRFDMCDHVYSL